MTDEEIIRKILEIQFKEKLNQKELAKMLGIGITHINRIINGKQRISPFRRKMFKLIFELYDEGKLK